METLDLLADRPGEQHVFLVATNSLFAWCIARGLADSNPALGIRSAPQAKHTRPWTAAEKDALLNCGDPMVATASALGCYTGQRISDVLRARWIDISDGEIHVIQQKTGAELYIPIEHALNLFLDGIPDHSPDLYIVGNSRVSLDPGKFRVRFVAVCRRLGLDCRFHGARVACAIRLAEAGCSTREIMAIGGWKTSRLVDLYTAQASQRDLARAAIRKVAHPDGARQEARNASA